MLFGRAYLGAVVCLALAMIMAESSSLDNDISTRLTELTEQMIKMSGQLSKLSEQQTKLSEQHMELYEQQVGHSGQLSKLAEQQIKISDEQVKQSSHQTKQTEHLNKLTNQVSELTDQQTDAMSRLHGIEGHQSSSGPVFIRWGRKTCNGTGSQTVYTGVAGGTPTSTAGGAADLLCLPRDPSYANHNNVDDIESGVVVVAEYKLDPASNFPFENHDPLLLDEDVPCAVCQVTNGSSVMMIPARVDCYSGWKLEYRGYLMAEAYNTFRSQYVCVDDNPEIDYGGGGTATHTVGLYVVETRCDYLPCPPFEIYAEAACVVCSK